MAYQFVHVQTLNRKTGAKLSGEADRSPGASPHVDRPAPAIRVGGSFATVTEAWAEIERRSAGRTVKVQCKDGVVRERAQRADACIGLAAVASYHVPMREIHGNATANAKLRRWVRDTLQQLEREHGPALCAVLHVDEAHPHIHAWFAPAPGAGMASIHPGIAARDAAAKDQPKRKAKDGTETRNRGGAAYVEAMRQYQDRFHESVGVRHGEARLGPSRRRLTRAEWHAEQKVQRALADSIRSYEVQNEGLKAACYAETQRADAAEDQRNDLAQRRENLLEAIWSCDSIEDLRNIVSGVSPGYQLG